MGKSLMSRLDISYVASPASHISDPNPLDLTYDGALNNKSKSHQLLSPAAGFDFNQALNNKLPHPSRWHAAKRPRSNPSTPSPTPMARVFSSTLYHSRYNRPSVAPAPSKSCSTAASLPDGSRVEGFSQNLQPNNTGASDTAPATAGMGNLIIGLADNATLKSGQTVFVSYNGGELRDTSNIPLATTPSLRSLPTPPRSLTT